MNAAARWQDLKLACFLLFINDNRDDDESLLYMH